jgi:hypothetical protein
MAIPDHTREFPPARSFREADRTTLYWIRGDTVLYRHYPLKGADVDSFSFYLGSFGKDHKHCYCTSIRLAGGNGATFRALNYTYATDGTSVWTMGGKIKDADAESFVVCDDGVHYLGSGSQVPYGFGKDKNRVYYYDFDGKPNWVRKASAASFVSLNDGHYGKDDGFVFCGAASLPKARVEHWRKIGGYYSKDDARVYYFNRLIRDADYDTFEVVDTGGFLQMAKDKNRFYDTDRVVSEAEFLDQIEKYGRKS